MFKNYDYYAIKILSKMKNIQYWAVTLVAFKASVPFAVSKSNRVENIFAESCNIAWCPIRNSSSTTKSVL